MSDIDAAILITLVQARPVLWDEFLDIYKDGDATNNAWHEVCVELHSAFDVLDNKDKILFREKVVRKWTCLRDLFAKLNKDKVSKKSCSAIKKLHFDQLQFLHKIYHEPNNKQGNKENIEPQLQASGSVLDDCTSLVQNSAYTPKGRKHEELDEFDLNISKALEEEKVCSNMTFLLSLMPCLQTFDDQTFLQFQMEVLKIIKNINEEVNPSNSTPDHSQL